MITDFASLKTSIANWHARATDTTFNAEVPTFIQLAEQDMFTKLRVREMVCEAQADLNEEYEWLPSGYLKMKFVNILEISDGPLATGTITGTYECKMKGNADFVRTTRTGNPQYHTIIGERLRFSPYPEVAQGVETGLGFEVVYYGEWTPLSDTATTNTILTNYPQIYLFGALLQGGIFLMNDEAVKYWEPKYEALVAAANLASETSEYGTVAMGLPSW